MEVCGLYQYKRSAGQKQTPPSVTYLEQQLDPSSMRVLSAFPSKFASVSEVKFAYHKAFFHQSN